MLAVHQKMLAQRLVSALVVQDICIAEDVLIPIGLPQSAPSSVKTSLSTASAIFTPVPIPLGFSQAIFAVELKKDLLQRADVVASLISTRQRLEGSAAFWLGRIWRVIYHNLH